MSTIEVPQRIAIGEIATLTLRGTAPRDCYISQNGVLLLEPLTLEPDIPLSYYPEAPGQYVIKTEDCEASLDVTEDVELYAGPALENGVWFPSAWTATLHRGYEPAAMSLLPELVHPGAVVYDLGASIGWYAMEFLRLGAGFVYCFEPNPVAMHYLSHNLAGARNALVLPLAVADQSGMVRLTVNPDNVSVGTGARAKHGITIDVQGHGLDDVIARYGLRAPDMIKMDIEGGETLAIKGMLQTIEKYRPVLAFELHGYRSARETLKYTDAYSWRIVGNERIYSAGELAAEFPDANVQVVGISKS